MLFIEKSLEDYIGNLASGDPVPGGGSASALAGSLGAALTNMVGNLTIGKKVFEELNEDVKAEMTKDQEDISNILKDLNHLVDEDTKAFDSVMEAFKMPKATDEEKAARTEAIQQGYKKALEVPLRIAEECYKVLELQKVFADYGNVNAITDIGVGTLLLYSGIEGALFNVTINLLSIKDQEYKKEMEERANNLLNKSKELKKEILETVYKRLG